MFLLGNEGAGVRSEAIEAWRLWFQSHCDGLYLSVVTLMEVRFGIEKCLARGAKRKAGDLRRWLVAAETAHRGRVVPVSAEIAHRAGELLWRAVASRVSPGSEDALIAATADVNTFTLLSRDGRHMGALGVTLGDPLQRLP